MDLATLCLCLAVLANAFANICMKKASGGTYASPLGMYLSPPFIIGMFFFGLNMLFYSRALKNYSLSQAYPLLIAGSLLVVTLIAYFGMGETVSYKNIIGMGLIITGICLIV